MPKKIWPSAASERPRKGSRWFHGKPRYGVAVARRDTEGASTARSGAATVTNLQSVPAELLGSLEIRLGNVADSFLVPSHRRVRLRSIWQH